MNKIISTMIIGAQKSGTTSLFRYLSEHPQIMTHPQQEMTYFVNDAEYAKGYEDAAERYFGQKREGSLILAKHVMLLNCERGLQRLREHNRNCVLVAVLRNPVERAYSAYWYARCKGWEKSRTFEEALKREEGKTEGKWYDHRYFQNGLYHDNLQRVFQYFPRQNVLIFLLDDLDRETSRVCKAIFRKMGVNEAFTPDIRQIHNKGGKAARSEVLAEVFARFLRSGLKDWVRTIIPNSLSFRLRYSLLKLNEKNFDVPPMKPETRQLLAARYRNHNARLGRLLGRDLTIWNHNS